MKSCMGGFCAHREKCPHYQANDRSIPAERLCIRGQDGWQVQETAAGAVVQTNVFWMLGDRPLRSAPEVQP